MVPPCKLLGCYELLEVYVRYALVFAIWVEVQLVVCKLALVSDVCMGVCIHKYIPANSTRTKAER